MYSYEIMQFLRERNFRIYPLEFMSIINTSPQIKEVPMDNDLFRITSDDGLNVGVNIIQETQKKLTLKKDRN